MNEFGKLVSVVGPVADVWFEHTPPLHQLLYALSDRNKPVPLEVVSHQGEGRVRCIALGATEGMYVCLLYTSGGDAHAKSCAEASQNGDAGANCD